MGTRIIDKVVVHCSASDEPLQDSVSAIRDLHTAPLTQRFVWGKYPTFGRQWRDIGYHYIITKDGRIHQGRKEHEIGAHCVGQNEDSLGICLTGDIRFTQAQFHSLERLLFVCCDLHNIPYEEVYTHRYFDPSKSCPNFDLSLTWPSAKDI